jgi:intracellular sulfur oxidation DsrE/DsrF family protein
MITANLRQPFKWAFLVPIIWAVAVSSSGAADLAADDKPFAEAHIVLQLSDADEKRQSIVLNVANNLIKYYGGPDMVDLEIVAFGPGISLLYKDSANAERIASLAANGIRFVACTNTLDTIERTTGTRPELGPYAQSVQAGVAHLVERSGQGFTIIRP